MRLLLVGCGRSGTRYAARLLTEAGLPCSHEKRFGLFSCGWQEGDTAESSWMALPALENHLAGKVLAVHLTRHPLDTIRSLVGTGFLGGAPGWALYRSWLCGASPRVTAKQGPLERAVWYWIEWNQRIENQTGFRVRVEDFTENIFSQISKVLDRPLDASALDRVPRNVNHGTPDQTISWQDISDPRLLKMAARYGYQPPEVSCPPPAPKKASDHNRRQQTNSATSR